MAKQTGQTPQLKTPKRPKTPKNPNVRCKAYQFRLYPTKKQIGTLEWTLRRCKELYNAALQERRDAYQLCGVSVSYGMQADQLPAIKQLRQEYQHLHSQVQQDVLRRLDKAFDAFFRRVENGETPGYPRFKSGDRYHSFTYPQGGYEIIGNRLHLSKIGHIKIKLHREIKGKIKTCTIKREGDQWYAVFSVEDELDLALTFHPSEEAVGIDWGSSPLLSCPLARPSRVLASIARAKRRSKRRIARFTGARKAVIAVIVPRKNCPACTAKFVIDAVISCTKLLASS